VDVVPTPNLNDLVFRHRLRHKDYDESKICPIKDGAREFLEKLSDKFDIEIFTVRDKTLVESWIKENNIDKFISKVTDRKNPYSQIIPSWIIGNSKIKYFVFENP